MPRHYKQNKADRLDESLGMRRGKESKKKQSYKSRRDESKGMKKAMKRHNEDMHKDADTQMYHKGKGYYGKGYGQPSNLPQEVSHHSVPEPYPRLKCDYADTMEEIDRDAVDNYRKVEAYPSDSMY